MEISTLYASLEPYPPIQVSNPNLSYAQLLTSVLASNKSELSTITQYTYFHWVIENEFAELGTHFLQIAKIEMLHLNYIGQIITALGGNPIFRSFPYKRPVFWNSGVLHYQSNIKKILHISITGEQTAIDNYQHLSKLIQDPYIILLLQRIILDEKIHLQIFQDYLTTIESESKL